MKKNYVTIMIAILALLVTGIFVVYDKLYVPAAKEYDSYLAVHQEFEASEISSILIKSSNHKVVIKSSNDNKVRVVYYQKMENANEFSLTNTKFNLMMVERAVNLDNLIFKSDKPIDTITIYVPLENNYVINIEAVDGRLSIEDISVKMVSFVNAYGEFKMKNSKSDKVYVSLNTGSITLEKIDCPDVSLDIIAGDIGVDLMSSLLDYNVNIKTLYGSLLVNGNPITDVDEESGQITNLKELHQENSNTEQRLEIIATRSNIKIATIETEEEIVEETTE